MGVEEIPADELVAMTDAWHRIFNAAGCNPMCHCCHKMILPQMLFKLSTIEKLPTKYFRSDTGYSIEANIPVEDVDKEITTKEVMLCDTCTPEMFLENQKEELKENLSRAKNMLKKRIQEGGCYRINGKIIH